MRLYNVKLLTITCEVMAQNKVKEVLEKHKVTGYTCYEVSGKGRSGLRGKGLPEEKNVKVEVLVREESLEKIVEEIARKLFADFSIIYYVSDVQVARIEKYA